MCVQVHALGNQAIDAVNNWDPKKSETHKAASTALKSLIDKVEEVLEIGRRTGGFTPAQREALDHAVDLANAVSGIRTAEDQLVLTEVAEPEIWKALMKMCCRLAPKAS
jgi:hypothetical protein